METETDIFSLKAKYSKSSDIVLVYAYTIDENILRSKKENKKKIR